MFNPLLHSLGGSTNPVIPQQVSDTIRPILPPRESTSLVDSLDATTHWQTPIELKPKYTTTPPERKQSRSSVPAKKPQYLKRLSNGNQTQLPISETSGSINGSIPTSINSSQSVVESEARSSVGPFDTYPERWRGLYSSKAQFYINKLTPVTCLPANTIKWIRNQSDERAAQEGMRFHEQSGQFVVDWVQDHCILYEGSKANSPLICDDWQFEYFMQLFGWLRNSEELGIWIRRFTHAGIWIAKKNAKSPTLAATGLFTFVGDGEPGQHCYSIAKDGKQALIAHTHAIEMVNNSPKLASEIRHKKTDNSLIHRRTKSTYSIVSGDNVRQAQTTEGYNGSLFVDETHVVDQQHMDRLKRAGISRIEPLHVEMSTAGNNADGYGFNRYQYGQRVAKMESLSDYNPHFLFMDFSVDQKVTAERLRDQPFIESIAPYCNPSMGRIIRKEEFLSDYRDSLQSDTELRKFAMYRLNLWLRDSAVWIELADWIRCAESPLRDELLAMDVERPSDQYTLEDLKEYPCVGGLDLSMVKDMSALTLIFAVPDDQLGIRPYTWTWHWLPEVTAIGYQRFVDFKSDDLNPYVHLLKSHTIDYDIIATKLEWIRSNFDFRGLGYDVFNSAPLLRSLYNDYGWSEEEIIKVPQQMRIMGPICKEVERWIIRHEIHHCNNKLMNWQFQHAALEYDKHGNYKVIKPEKDDYRKVDGIVSMLIAAAVLTTDPSIWSKDSGSILLYERKPADGAGRPTTINLAGGYEQENLGSYKRNRGE